jgi:hypothetical protein
MTDSRQPTNIADPDEMHVTVDDLFDTRLIDDALWNEVRAALKERAQEGDLDPDAPHRRLLVILLKEFRRTQQFASITGDEVRAFHLELLSDLLDIPVTYPEEVFILTELVNKLQRNLGRATADMISEQAEDEDDYHQFH